MTQVHMTDHSESSIRPVRPLASRALMQRNQRVNQYRRLVTPIAVHYSRRCPEPLDDLLQVGMLGLLRAAELYQPKTATPFEAFARPHIRGAILHYLRDFSLAVRLPRRQMELHDRLRQLKSGWCASHGSEPTAEELRVALELSPHQWQELLRGQAMARPSALEDGAEDWLALEPDNVTGREEQIGCDENMIKQLGRLEPCLREVIQKVVLAGWTYRRTAALMQVSPMTVQRRLKRGLTLLKERLDSSNVQSGRRSQGISCCRIQHPAASAAQVC